MDPNPSSDEAADSHEPTAVTLQALNGSNPETLEDGLNLGEKDEAVEGDGDERSNQSLDSDKAEISQLLSEKMLNPSTPKPEPITAEATKHEEERETVDDQCARYYYLPLDDESVFSASSLVWGKVKSHPWWPGEIYDPLFASEMALKHHKDNGKFLVAYFGDKTFAWNDESQLKSFSTHFSAMTSQSKIESFANAIDAALNEVTRRVELGMSCSCFVGDEYTSKMECKTVENAGIREGTCSAQVSKSSIVGSFQPDRLINYIKSLAQSSLAQSSFGGADRLEIATAKAQLKVFYWAKGYPELAAFFHGEGLIENYSENLPAKRKKSDTDNGLATTSVKQKSKDGKGSSSKLRHISKHGKKQKKLTDLMEEKDDAHLGNSSENDSEIGLKSAGKKRTVAVSDLLNFGRKKKKKVGSLGDLEAKARSPRYIKVGDGLRRVASKLTGSPPIFKARGEAKSVVTRGEAKSVVTKVNRRGRDLDAVDTTQTQTDRSRFRKGASKVYPSTGEILPQLYLVASDPMKGYKFLPTITSFFADFWASIHSRPLEDKDHLEPNRAKRGRKKSVDVKSASKEEAVPDYVQDSYWSDLLLHNSSEEEEEASGGIKRKGRKSLSRSRKKKTKVSNEQTSQSRGRKKKKKKMKPSSEEPPSSLSLPPNTESDAEEIPLENKKSPSTGHVLISSNTEPDDAENLQDGSTGPCTEPGLMNEVSSLALTSNTQPDGAENHQDGSRRPFTEHGLMNEESSLAFPSNTESVPREKTLFNKPSDLPLSPSEGTGFVSDNMGVDSGSG